MYCKERYMKNNPYHYVSPCYVLVRPPSQWSTPSPALNRRLLHHLPQWNIGRNSWPTDRSTSCPHNRAQTTITHRRSPHQSHLQHRWCGKTQHCSKHILGRSIWENLWQCQDIQPSCTCQQKHHFQLLPETWGWEKVGLWAAHSQPSSASEVQTPPATMLAGIGACRPGHTRALPGLFWIMHTHIMRTGCEDTNFLGGRGNVVQVIITAEGTVQTKREDPKQRHILHMRAYARTDDYE